MLFYTTKGEFGKEDFEVTAEYIYLQDIGTSGYTEYDMGTDIIQFMMKHPEYQDMRMGHIHSHNTMGVFFSGTDTGEIVDNSANHAYYVSLIVNNRNEMCAKIAFRGISQTYKEANVFYPKESTEPLTTETQNDKKEVVLIFECDIQSSYDNQEFLDRIEEVDKSTKNSRVSHSNGTVYGSNTYYGGTTSGRFWKDEEDDKTPNGVATTQTNEDRMLTGPKIEKLAQYFLHEDTSTYSAVFSKIRDMQEEIDGGRFNEKDLDRMGRYATTAYRSVFPTDYNMEYYAKAFDRIVILLRSRYQERYKDAVDKVCELIESQIS